MYECKIAERITQLRLAKGVTQEEMAQNLSVSNKAVSKWETGTSAPELSTLAELSAYFGVTTDFLLGLSDNKPNDTGETVRSMFEGLDRKEAIRKTFETECTIIPTIFGLLRSTPSDSAPCGEKSDDEAAYPSDYSRAYRSHISTPDLFKFTASSENINLSVTLLGNKNNFAWLKDPKKQQKMGTLFRFLSSEDALPVLYFIHSAECPEAFTSDYVSAHTGVTEERVAAVLKAFCKMGGCSSLPAHLAEGDVEVYECFGDGMVLSILSLAYEKMCGSPLYQYAINGSCKMIGEK